MFFFALFFLGWRFLGGVDGEFADDPAGGGVADGDVVVDEHQDMFAGVGATHADVASTPVNWPGCRRRTYSWASLNL